MKIVKGKKMAQTTKLTIFSFLGLIITGGLLLNLPIANMPGKPHDIINSLFTAAASVCVAGLTTVSAGEQYTLFGKVVILALIQIRRIRTDFYDVGFNSFIKAKSFF